jgi:hypothetical protein
MRNWEPFIGGRPKYALVADMVRKAVELDASSTVFVTRITDSLSL